jgi:hypothetical protein
MFFKKGKGLCGCVWNQGGGGPKSLGTTGIDGGEWPASLPGRFTHS